MKTHSDAIIIGAGIAGLVAAYELLKKGQKVTIFDAQPRKKIGGLARTAFGGMALVGTPEQKLKKVKDSPEIALADWHAFAQFNQEDHWPKAWAKLYVERSREDIYDYVKSLGVSFLPAVNWVERGLYTPGNSLPRYHVLWGCGLRLVEQLVAQILPYEGGLLELYFETKVSHLIQQNNAVSGCEGITSKGKSFTAYADNTFLACGGFTGNIEKVKSNWPKSWGKAPQQILNGSHISNDGQLHDEVARLGGNLTHMDKMWNYAAGIPHPEPEFSGHGLSLIPCKSALWLDHRGQRIDPRPLVTGFDTSAMCEQLSQQEKPYSWQLLNWRIAAREFAISGVEHNQMIRDRRFFMLLKELLFGNHRLVSQIQQQSDHFIVASNLTELVSQMNQLNGKMGAAEDSIQQQRLQSTISDYDEMVKRGSAFWNDDQLRRIMQSRQWFSDKLRTCYPKPILDGSPLIAIRTQLISRKSLGGMQTDLDSRVLDQQQKPMQGLFAIGEAAGFGGGGASGKRSLEGTFLSGCILTARQAVRAIS